MNRITSLFGIRYPIIQGGMVWCSGWRLASAGNAGGLGLLLGQVPCILKRYVSISVNAMLLHIILFGVNIALMYPQIEEIMQIVVEEGVNIVSLPPEALPNGRDG